jgi:transposase
MIVLGADTHKSSHTIAAVDAATGQVLGEKTVAVGARGFGALVLWARGLAGERAWALEDCRHVSGALERFLVARGERVVRVSTRLMATSRRSARERGKSGRIDALAVARAALAEGVETLPTAELAGPELDVRLLVDHRERLVRQRVGLNNTLQWNLHDLWPELSLPGGAVLAQVEQPDRPAPGARRADDARPDCPRRAAPTARADPGDQSARG